MHINALFRGNPSNSTYICSVWSPKNGKFIGNPWRNPRVGPKQKALGAPRSHLQPSAWEDLEDVRYRWHVPPSRSGWFHGIPLGFQLRQFTADRIICVISHGHKTGENSALLLGGFPENCSDFYWTSEIWKTPSIFPLILIHDSFYPPACCSNFFSWGFLKERQRAKRNPSPKTWLSSWGAASASVGALRGASSSNSALCSAMFFSLIQMLCSKAVVAFNGETVTWPLNR